MGETLDGAPLPEPPPSEEDADTADDFPVDKTLDGGDPSETPPAEDLIGDTDDRQYAETLDSDRVPPMSLPSGGNPLSSIKAEGRAAVAESKQVIPSRVVCQQDGPRLPDADYEVLGKIDKGGVGIIYSARQASIGRQVALKMLKPERADDQGQRASLISEAVVTGDLEHPNIVPIYDLGIREVRRPEGEAKGELFYSMKHVQGTEWQSVISSQTEEEDLDALLKVCDAVAFAHSRKVIHRDLKPRNIMLGDFGEVLVMDWGLATSPDDKGNGEAEGTPAYMAPEMAQGHTERIGFHSDVYLLGAILYEIITGNPPHPGETVKQSVAAAAENEIRPTNRSGELLDIALKAMATAPEDRHADVGEFQDAVRQYQAHSQSSLLATRAKGDLDEAEREGDYKVFARALFGFQEALELWDGNAAARSGVSEAATAYAGCALNRGDFDLGISLLDNLDEQDPQRNKLHQRLQTGARDRDRQESWRRNAKRIGLALVATIFVVIIGSFFWVLRAEGIAVKEKEEADRQRGIAVEQKGIAVDRKKEADRQKGIAIDQKEEADRQKGIAVEQTKEANRQRTIAEKNEEKAQYSAYVTRIGLAEASIGENAFDRAGTLLQQCPEEQKTTWEWGHLWHLCTQARVKFNAQQRIEAVAFSPDGGRFATGGWGGTVDIWDTATRNRIRTLENGVEDVFAVAFSPDGKHLAAGTNDKPNYIKIWNVDSGELVQELAGHGDAVLSVVYSKDGQKLLTSSYDGTAKLWDLTTGEVLQTFEGHDWWVWSAAFDPNEKRVVTASQDGTAIVWTVKTDKTAETEKEDKADETDKANKKGPAAFRGHKGPVYAAAFSPDGRHVASAGYDKRVLLWEPKEATHFDIELAVKNKDNPAPVYEVLSGHTAPVRSLQFFPRSGAESSPDSDEQLLVSGSNDNTVRVWDPRSGELLRTLRGHGGWVLSCAFDPQSSIDNPRILSGSHDRFARIWSFAEYEELRVFGRRIHRGHKDAVLGGAFSFPDGLKIASASRDRTASIWDFNSGEQGLHLQEGHEYLASTALFYPDGKRLLTAAVDNTTRIWDVSTGAQQFRLDKTGANAVVAVSQETDSQKARWILTGSDQDTAKLWNAQTGELIRELDDHHSEVTAVAVSTNNQWLMTGDRAGKCRLWDANKYALLWESAKHSRAVNAAVFLPGQGQTPERLLTASADNTVAQWDLKTGEEHGTLLLKHPDAVTSMALSADDRLLVTSCGDNVVRLWDVDRAVVVGKISGGDETVNRVAIVAGNGGQGFLRVATTSAPNVVRLWDLRDRQEIREITGADGNAFLRLDPGSQLAWSAVFHPDGKRLLTVGGNEACLWDIDTGDSMLDFSPHDAVASAHYSHDGKYLITGSWDGTAKVWNTETGIVESRLRGGHDTLVNSAVFHPDDSTTALTASNDTTAKLWKLASENGSPTWAVVRTFTGHTGRVSSAVFSPDGNQVLTVSDDKTARVWDTATGEELPFSPLKEHIQSEFTHDQAVLCAAYSRDGQWIVTGSEDNTARLWHAATGKPAMAGDLTTEEADESAEPATDETDEPALVEKAPLILEGHSAGVTSVAFSPDGERVITGSRDRMAKLWELRGGDEILTLKKHAEEVTCVAFSLDGKSILTGSRDGTLILWPTTKPPSQKPPSR